MKKTVRVVSLLVGVVLALLALTGCSNIPTAKGTKADVQAQITVANVLTGNQPTPTDINYSLERYNLIRRAYWVNGQREKANALACAVEKPLGYIVLFAGNTVVGNFIVDGKVTSLNSFLSPDSEYYEYSYGEHRTYNKWLADVDGSYGENDDGIFFFTPDGKYIEWTGEYLYSDIPFIVDSPVVRYERGVADE
jgi:hypothetical protein